MRVAVVGAGISGLTAARELDAEHDVHLFEAAPRAGGHAYTVEVEEGNRRFPVDMGFIVYNERNYPVFGSMLEALGVETAPSSMGFSVSDRDTGLEYSGEGWSSLLAAPTNALRPDFWRVVRDFVRFCRRGREALAADSAGTVASFCHQARLSRPFQRLFLRPMAGAIWSMPRNEIDRFPARTLLRFFERHGLLSVTGRPAWRTVQGGSRRYVDAVVAALDATVHLGVPVETIERRPRGVQLRAGGEWAHFDEVVIATHSDRALRMLADPSPAERTVLAAIAYRPNEAVLHRDRRVLPRRRRAWASWNVAVEGSGDESIAVTYLMNKLQPLPTDTPWCVTLNRTAEIDPAAIRHRVVFDHPQFDRGAVEAQARWPEISGSRHTHYAGAYWRYGFHEDGAWSGRRAAGALADAGRRAA